MVDSEDEARWPSLGDRAFVKSPPCYGASIAEDGGERLWRMIRGYQRAADLLVAKTEAEPWEGRDLIYPIVFSYRHSLELALKQLVENHGDLIGQPANRRSHHLDVIWPMCRLLMEHFNPKSDPEPLDVLEDLVKDFSEIDPSSVLFRYASDQKGALLESGLGHIDLAALRHVMAGVHNLLECVDAQISEICNEP
ncbi:MAG: hypothetical protein ACRYGC_15320 [Janthinobacterium lividum]